MKLKRQLNLERFFASARKCVGEVYFLSAENDRLNLKSALCCFLFTAACRESGMALRGEVICDNAEDEARMAEFCE